MGKLLRGFTVQRLAAVLMLGALCYAALAVMMFRESNAQTLRDELERTGLVSPIVNQNSNAIAAQRVEIEGLRSRVSAIEQLGLDRRVSLLEKATATAEENQKWLWGIAAAMAVFGIKEFYQAFSRIKSKS